LNQTGLLINNDSDLVELSKLYANKYKDPEYRFNSIDVLVDQRTLPQQESLLALELSDVVEIKLTPNGIAPAISKFAEIIRIDHSVSTLEHILSLGFSTIEKSPWTLSDLVFGRLSANNILGF